MVLLGQKFQRQVQASVTATALGVALAAIAPSTSALANFPGERWNTPYVQISGNADPSVASAIQSGLKTANETYFYGDRATKMQATLSAPGKVDVRILDASSGKVIAEQRGLSYTGSGSAAAASITQSALAWMDGLGCADGGCQVATSGGAAPQSATQIAEAPQVEQPKAEPVESQPEPKAAPVLTPTAPQPTADASAPEQPSAQSVAEEVLAILQPETEQPSPLAPAEPTRATPAAKPTGTGSAEATPATGEAGTAPKAAEANLSEPTTGDAAAPSGSLASGATPATGQSSGTNVVLSTPALQEPDPAQPSAPEGGQDADKVLAALEPEQEPETAVQNVLPGIVLPVPRPGDGVTPVGELLGANPAVDTAAEEAPTQSTELALAEPAATAAPQTAQGSAQAGQGSVSVGGAETTAATPEIETEEPERAAQPADVSGVPSTDTPALAGSSDDASFSSPTPVARLPQSQPEAPSTPSAEITTTAPAVSASSGAPNVQSDDGTLTAPSVDAEQPVLAAGTSGEIGAPSVGSTESSVETPQQAVAAPSAPSTPAAPAVRPQTPESGSGEQLALANPQAEVQVPQPAPSLTNPSVGQVEAPASPSAPSTQETTTPAPSSPAAPEQQAEPEATTGTGVDVQVASVDPTASGPTLANARWVGFTPAVYTGSDTRSGAWISGPFDRKQRTGWITDTATGATTRVTFIWREGGSGARTATLSRDAAQALGLNQGDVANVAVYLPR